MDAAYEHEVIASLDDISKMLGALLSRDRDTQSEVIIDLADTGMDPARIAKVLGAKPDSVRKAISRAERR